MLLSDSTTVVTGASSPIGRAVIAELCVLGGQVLAIDADAARLSDVSGHGVSTLAADVMTPQGRRQVTDAAGQLTHLVITGAASNGRPLAEVDEPYWDEAFGAGARATFFLCRDLIERLPLGGAVVVVSSVAAKTSRNAEVTVYSASEAAVLSIARSFANTYGSRGIRVNAICHGIIESPDNDDYLRAVAASRGISVGEVAATRLALVPLGRAGTAEECAATIRYLLSDDAGFITGQALNVTGGFHNY